MYLLVFTLATYSCNRLPESYPPPEQRHPTEGVSLLRASMMVNMNDQDAEAHFVKDIGLKLEGGYWRWAQKQPTVKILLAKTQGLKFTTNFTLYEGCMAQTGPVVISFRIGDKLLAKERYTTPGYKHFEKPVPADWLQTSAETLVSEEIDKVFVSPEDGVKLGFILSNIGFERQ